MSVDSVYNNRIHQYWEFFFAAETGTYEKSTWLDLFLAEFLILLKDGANPSEIISFCPVSGVVTLVGCELLCGIHRVTSSINTQYTPPIGFITSEQHSSVDAINRTESSAPFANRCTNQTSLQILQNYLLKGSAWRCLILLQTLGVEGLSCSRQLCSVLIWIYDEISGGVAAEGHGYNAHIPRDKLKNPVHELLSKKIWMKPEPSGGSNVKTSGKQSSGVVLNRNKNTSTKTKHTSFKQSKVNTSAELSSDSDDHKDDLEALNLSLTLKAKLLREDFGTADKIGSNYYYDSESPSSKKCRPKTENFKTEKHREILESEITPFEFRKIVICLLQELSKAESSISSTGVDQIPLQCINFALRNLCSLQFGSCHIPSVESRNVEVSQTKALLTELLLLSLDKVLLRSDFFSRIINDGILPILLRLLEDITHKLSLRLQLEKSGTNQAQKLSSPEKDEAAYLVTFIFGIAYSISAFLFRLLLQSRNLDKLKDFTKQFKLFSDCQKGTLLKRCISVLIRIPGVEKDLLLKLLKKLLSAVGKLILGMKKVRSEAVHSSLCTRNKHKICKERVAAGMHHHHNILGDSTAGLGLSSTCSVSILYATLTLLLTDECVSAEPVLRSKILKVMLNSGSCCCFPPGYLVENVVKLILTHNGVASTCLTLLEHTIFGELGASVLKNFSDQLPCAVCEQWSNGKPQLRALQHTMVNDKKDIPQCSYSEGVSTLDKKSAWSFLIHYNSLLQLDNTNSILYATVNHLMRITPRCRLEIKYELLFSVLYPSFIVAKHRYILRHEDSAYFLTLSCLSIFANLLNTISFAEHFIQKGGLAYVLELVSLPEFSKQSCSIIEIAIIVEIWKLQRDSRFNLRNLAEFKSLPSLTMMVKTLNDVVEKCFAVYKLKLSEETFDILKDTHSEALGLHNSTEHEVTSVDQPAPSPTAYFEIPFSPPFYTQPAPEATVNDYLKVLKNAYTFIRACAGLCLYSPLFRAYIVQEKIFIDSYGLLKLLMYIALKSDTMLTEVKIAIKILEGILTIHLSVCDVTMGRSKQVSLQKLREIFLSDKILSCDSNSLKLICEMLIRVATTFASNSQVMPPLNKAKLPPLLCTSPSSEIEYSSSEEEESVGPYMSEASDHSYQTADEGYDGDVELGHANLSSRSRVFDSVSSAEQSHPELKSNMNDYPIECKEYTKSGTITHPELCSLVIDILVKLIEKLMTKSGKEEDSKSINNMGVSLARACCVRLSRSHPAVRPAAHAALHSLFTAPVTTLLAITNEKYEDLQKSILELIYVLGSQSILHPELSSYLQLFKASQPPVNLLLDCLSRLVDNAQNNMPDFILSFPVNRWSAEEMDKIAKAKKGICGNQFSNISSQCKQSEETVQRISGNHLKAGVTSAWSTAACCIGVEGAWPAAVGLWVNHMNNFCEKVSKCDDNWSDKQESTGSLDSKVSPDSRESSVYDNDDVIHVVSFGNESLLIETWLLTRKGSLSFKLSRPEESSNKILSEATIETNISQNNWSFIAFNVRNIVNKGKLYIQITVFMNGVEAETCSLQLSGIVNKKFWSLLVGHTSTFTNEPSSNRAIGSVYHLANLTLLRAPAFNAYNVLYMMAQSPNGSVLSNSEVKYQQPNFASLLSPYLLSSNVDWDQVFVMSTVNIRELQENVLLTFSAQSPSIMNLYHQTAASHTVFPGRTVPNISNLGATAFSSAIPETLFVAWKGEATPGRYRGLPPALYLLGGPEVLLLLFARIVELDASAERQANSLSMLFKLCYADTRLYNQFYQEECLLLVQTVLASDKCLISHYMLRVFIDAACNRPVLAVVNGNFFIPFGCDSILSEPKFLIAALNMWKEMAYATKPEDVASTNTSEHGIPCPNDLFGTLMLSILTLLRDDHPHRTFNVAQANRNHLLTHLLSVCKERYLNSECGPMASDTIVSLVEVIRSLVGAPPLVCHVAQLMDFLVIMHPASDTFVTHSRANFYFLLTPEIPTNEDTNVLQSLTRPFLSKRKSTRKTQRHSRINKSNFGQTLSTSHSSDDLVNQKSANIIKDSMRDLDNLSLCSYGENLNITKSFDSDNLSRDEDNSNLESENESIKMESLHQENDENHHLRNVLTSSSEGKESTATEEKSGQVKNEDGCLTNDYIVIESEEADKLAEPMYTSGIFHQRRVIAGAEGGGLVVGVMALLKDAICVMTDNALIQMYIAIRAETAVGVAARREPAQRAAAVRLVAALLQRSPAEEIKRLHSIQYFYHLANQLSLYPADEDLVAACVTLITKCEAPLNDQMEECVWREVDEASIRSAPPLVALLPQVLHDVPLTHHLATLFNRIVDKASVKVIMELAIVEVVIKAIQCMDRMGEFDGRHLIADDFTHLIVQIVFKALDHQHTLQTVVEILEQLWCARSGFQSNNYGANSQCKSCGLTFAAVLLASIGYLHATSTLHARYFSTVVTSSQSSDSSIYSSIGSNISKSEIGARQKMITTKAVEYFITMDPEIPFSSVDLELFEKLFDVLLCDRNCSWRCEMASDLWWWVISGERAELQAWTLRALYHKANRDVLGDHAPSEMSLLLSSALRRLHGDGDRCCVETCVSDWAREWALALQAALPARVPAVRLPRAAAALKQAARSVQRKARRTADIRARRSLFIKDVLASKVTESAMSLTRSVVEKQNVERKAFMEHLRKRECESACSIQKWRQLIDKNTHELALWHDDESYPKSWELDPTEGPGRIRVRLRRCHLDIPSRFLKERYKYKADSIKKPPPLSYLFTSTANAIHNGLLERLHMNESVQHMARATLVSLIGEQPGDLLLTDRCIHFVPENGSGAEAWPLRSVEAVRARRWCLRERGAEVFLRGGRAVLLAFDTSQDMKAALSALHSLRPGEKSETDSLTDATNQWRNGSITNWEYLMRLNGLAGRSYNDLMQYPIMPFILADYTSKILDLTTASSFRDLSKPMAVQDKNNETHYIKNYNYLKQAIREGSGLISGVNKEPYHYGSHYSNSGTVLHFLVRLPPFTKQFLSYQDNNFDIPDRTFHSLATTWRLTSCDSTTDVKELIPEFFYLPEFLNNNEGLNLGVRQCGAAVDDVELPTWAINARFFILLHRQALESPLVTEGLPHWIDLVFGFKQTGQPAVDAVNVFHPATYYGFDPSSIEDKVVRDAWETMVRTYGQTPRQLFKQPHPHKNTDLYQSTDAQDRSITCGALGVRRGNYAGRISGRRRTLPSARAPPRLQPAHRTLALSTNVSLLITLDNKQPSHSLSNNSAVSMGVLSWGHSDNMVRLKTRKDQPPEIIMHIPGIDSIVCGVAGGETAWLGARGGGVWAVRGRSVRRVCASAESSVRALALSPPFRVAAVAHTSVSLWDMFTLSYIRTLPNKYDIPIAEMCISETLCDVATVHDLSKVDEQYRGRFQSLIRVFTVNGHFVGSVKVLERVNCICYSNAPEGISINAIAVGLDSGIIRLYSSWDLKPINDLPAHSPGIGIVSITYSFDSQQLFGACADGTLLVWENADTGSKPHQIRIFSSQNIF